MVLTCSCPGTPHSLVPSLAFSPSDCTAASCNLTYESATAPYAMAMCTAGGPYKPHGKSEG